MSYDYPRLCGGTYFTLLLQALKQRTNARGRVASERDGLSNPEVLSGLIRVAKASVMAVGVVVVRNTAPKMITNAKRQAYSTAMATP